MIHEIFSPITAIGFYSFVWGFLAGRGTAYRALTDMLQPKKSSSWVYGLLASLVVYSVWPLTFPLGLIYASVAKRQSKQIIEKWLKEMQPNDPKADENIKSNG